MGVSLPTTLPTDATLHLRTWWTTRTPETHRGKFYQASLRLIDSNGDIWAQIDAPPGTGDYRPERWPANTLILGHFDLPLDPATPCGTYGVHLLLYDEGTTTAETVLGQFF
jgi:hypothetical protein